MLNTRQLALGLLFMSLCVCNREARHTDSTANPNSQSQPSRRGPDQPRTESSTPAPFYQPGRFGKSAPADVKDSAKLVQTLQHDILLLVPNLADKTKKKFATERVHSAPVFKLPRGNYDVLVDWPVALGRTRAVVLYQPRDVTPLDCSRELCWYAIEIASDADPSGTAALTLKNFAGDLLVMSWEGFVPEAVKAQDLSPLLIGPESQCAFTNGVHIQIKSAIAKPTP
jgi:hypothetical protein